jgi:LysR family transcriptional regulator of abg operon
VLEVCEDVTKDPANCGEGNIALMMPGGNQWTFIPMPKFHHLRDFVAIARAESVRSAARNLGLTQPALTRSLRELEQEIGGVLCERHARGVILTPLGERFLLRAQASLEELRRGMEEAAQITGNMQGQVVVALSSVPVLTTLPAAFVAFRKSCPDVRLRIVEGLFPAVEPMLRDGRLDFYLGAMPERALGSSYRIELMFHNERVVLARKGHPLGNACSIKTLLDAEWIVTGLRGRLEEEFEEQFVSFGLETPRIFTVVESMLALLSLVSTTDALAFLPRQWTDTPLFKDLVQPIAIRENLIAPDIVQVSRAKMPLTPAAEKFSVMLQRASGKPFRQKQI